MHCGKTAYRIWMPFGIIGRTGPEMRQVVRFEDRSTGRGTFGGEFGACHCPQGPIGRTCATASRRGPLAKLLWADLFITVVNNTDDDDDDDDDDEFSSSVVSTSLELCSYWQYKISTTTTTI